MRSAADLDAFLVDKWAVDWADGTAVLSAGIWADLMVLCWVVLMDCGTVADTAAWKVVEKVAAKAAWLGILKAAAKVGKLDILLAVQWEF